MSTKKRGKKTTGRSNEPAGLTISQRLAQVRRSFAGERGQLRFARQLGISPSTYSNYEKNRTPPPQLLVRAAELTGADLIWLLTGKGAGAGQAVAPTADGPGRTGQQAILMRAAGFLSAAANPDAAGAALAAFLDLLQEKTRLERSSLVGGPANRRAPASVGPRLQTAEKDSESRIGKPRASTGGGRWAPIFGRAAAGLARFWAELNSQSPGAFSEPSALDRMIQEAATVSDADSHLAVLELVGGETDSGGADAQSPGGAAPGPRDVRVRLVQLHQPITDYQLTEFLEAPTLAERFRPLFGLRLDGDSMAPLLPDGTIVLCCPGEPARAGAPAVVRLAGQIGLTCKIYRPRGAFVRLVPANRAYPTQEFPAKQLEWALAVLGSARLG